MLATFTSLAFAAAVIGAAPDELTGRVTDANDSPISQATVAIIKAAPSEGTGTIAETDYPDCVKTTKTDVDGNFRFADLQDGLKFQLIASKLGHLPTKTEFVAGGGENVSIQLTDVDLDLPNNRKLTARVVDEEGNAVVGAQVYPFGGKTDRRRWWGPMQNLDQIAVTDEHGRFHMTSSEPMLGMDVKVYARGFVPLKSDLLELTGMEHTIRMKRGAAVSGVLQLDGKPVANQVLGIVQCDRGHATFVGRQKISTAEDGTFKFSNLPPNYEMALYSLCDPSFPAPVLKTIKFRTPANGKTTDLGVRSMMWGLSITGKIETPNESEIPKGARLTFGRDPAWDSVQVPIQTDGTFVATALPPEVYRITVRIHGLDVDQQKLNYQMIGENRFGLRLRSDLQLSIPMVQP